VHPEPKEKLLTKINKKSNLPSVLLKYLLWLYLDVLVDTASRIRMIGMSMLNYTRRVAKMFGETSVFEEAQLYLFISSLHSKRKEGRHKILIYTRVSYRERAKRASQIRLLCDFGS